jgi:hypothetical protein
MYDEHLILSLAIYNALPGFDSVFHQTGKKVQVVSWGFLYGMLLEWIDPKQMHLYQAEAPRVMASAYAYDLVVMQISTGNSDRQIGYLPSVHFQVSNYTQTRSLQSNLEKNALEDQSTSLCMIIHGAKLPVKLYDVMGGILRNTTTLTLSSLSTLEWK